MIDNTRASMLARAINRLCDILEDSPRKTEGVNLSEVSFCQACGVLYSLKYGHYCAKNAPPEDR